MFIHPEEETAMAEPLKYNILGDDLQLVEILLDAGQAVRAEVGTMTYLDEGVEMQTSTGGGILKGLARAFTGESFFVTAFLNKGQRMARAAFAAPYPGKIVPLDLRALGGTFLCQKDSFLCAAEDVEIELAFTKRLGAGVFGGEGFILQRLKGNGLAFVHAGGTIVERDLTAGESLRVDTGCLVAFAPTVDYDIQFIGGFTNVLFGGEGLFFARLKGPGKVFLQSLPFSRLADRILAAARHGKTDERRGVAGVGGNLLGNFLSGR
jgi:uncharacterized protein (TIGR00266 family)